VKRREDKKRKRKEKHRSSMRGAQLHNQKAYPTGTIKNYCVEAGGEVVK